MIVSVEKTADQVSAALSVAALRHQVIASNIAHRDSVGYERLALRFADALGRDEAAGPPQVVPEEAQASGKPSLEQDMLALSGNAMNYQALARVLGRYFTIAETIAGGGRS